MQKKHGKKKTTALTRDWFDQWSNEYDRTLGKISFHIGLLELLAAQARVKDGDRVLDIGCGTGLLSLKLLEEAACLVTGIDCSKEMAAIFQDKVQKLDLHGRVTIQLMDAVTLEFPDGTFDRVVSSVALHHLKDKLPVLKKICRVLKPGGVFLLGEVDMDTTGDHSDPERLKRILRVLEQEYIPALKDVGVECFSKMYDNGKKHILNQGEFCLSLKQWAALCRKAGFGAVKIKRVRGHKCFGIVLARKMVRH